MDSIGIDAVPAGLAQAAAVWPLVASLTAAAMTRGVLAGRRRTALNEALHELRRPLQSLALFQPGRPAEGAGLEWSLRLATAALERLDREINGEAAVSTRVLLPARPLLEAAVERWQSRAALAGGSLRLEWRAGEGAVRVDRCELAQALDNLIVNALEHGGPSVVVGVVEGEEGILRISVVDSGRGSRSASRRVSASGAIARISGRRRHGHGLRVVRRIAAAHGAEFSLRCSAAGTEAVLELPGPGAGAPG